VGRVRALVAHKTLELKFYSAVHSAEDNRQFPPLYTGIGRKLGLCYQGFGGIVKLGSWRSTAELLPPCLLIMIGSLDPCQSSPAGSSSRFSAAVS